MPENKDKKALVELGERIKQAKLNSQGEEERGRSSSAMSVGIDLVAGVASGSFIGYYLDKWLGTLPVFFIICFFLGVAGAFRNILRSAENSDDARKGDD